MIVVFIIQYVLLAKILKCEHVLNCPGAFELNFDAKSTTTHRFCSSEYPESIFYSENFECSLHLSAFLCFLDDDSVVLLLHRAFLPSPYEVRLKNGIHIPL